MLHDISRWTGAVLALLVASLAAADGSLRVRVGDFYPNYYRDAQGQWQGLDVDLTRALLQRAGLEYQLVSIPWSRALRMAERGEVHLLMNTNITPERSNYLYWIGPQRYTQLNLIVREDHRQLPIDSLDDLVTACQTFGKPFGYQPDVKYMPAFMQRLSEDPAFQRCMEPSTQPVNDDKVLYDRLLGYFAEPFDVLSERRLNPQYRLVVHPFVAIREPVFFAASKSAVDVPTLLRLHEAHESLIADGTFKAIRTRWESPDQVPIPPHQR